jgi:hypothetical protein
LAEPLIQKLRKDTGAVKTIEPEGDVAPPRYFHIAAVWGDIMWIWGGLSRANLNDMFSFTFKEKEGASTEAAVVNFRELLGSPIFSDIEFVKGHLSTTNGSH